MEKMRTERLTIRRFTPEDWKGLHEYLSLEEVVKYEPYHTYSLEECKEEAIYRSRNEAFLAVCLTENNKLIGNIYFEQQEPKEFMTWEIGYVFNPAYYGKGYATEACIKILQYAFENLSAHRIIGMCNPENVASWKVLERLGMRREGHFLKNVYFKRTPEGSPIWIDSYQYAVLAKEWPNQ